MKWFRFDIENKILIPFMILFILAIVTLGSVSYWTGYQMLLRNETDHLQKHLQSFSVYLNELNAKVETGELALEEAKGKAIAFYYLNGSENGFIMAEDRLLASLFITEEEWISTFAQEEKSDAGGSMKVGNSVLVYRKYPPWNWTLGYGMNRQLFSETVLESQKYIILLAIVSLVVSMQAAILVAYHISNPVRQLVDAFSRIGRDHMSEKISFSRKDEIGQLAEAFNEMMERLRLSTTKLLDMTRFNEDILRSITTGIITTDADGKVLSANPAAKEILNTFPKDPEDDLINVKEIRHQINTTLSRGKCLNRLHTLEKEGLAEKRYLDSMTSQLKNEKEEVIGVICSFRDITERKRIENNMELLDRLSSIGQLAAGMAHEIRNPLAGMKTSLQVLQRRSQSTENETSHRLFQSTLYEIDRIDSLITELLNFARPRKPTYEIVDVSKVLYRTLELQRKSIEEKKVHVEMNLTDSMLCILADSHQLEQIFLNLMINAINAMKREGTLTINIFSDQKKKGIGADNPSQVVIEFKDNGKGMKADEIEKIFLPFYTTDPQGTGLGLSVVHELVKENNGKIEVNSKEGEGSCFRILFPEASGEGG
ncbi:sensor histidine kinase [Tindallia californiensis]|uniref:histidine kinase n=1 Tax=Tindallia californiensis TaxID=159292 RepID=A0A1H3LER7_9FIRM|nr:ATP-binding protein [Tindallia californiensis]SDY62434.1 PAS domain-containing protein [Tindallia californiensis]